ncbi:hypothetical protein F5Y14DRAFT_457662 [Nemania sp. NC0429]|nr:hypothetical protein F5Y14DRAFT_457662 [Nemania sp. NC0429]
MTFGSTKPTSKTQTPLKLQWDCAGKGDASRKLVDFWVEESNTTRIRNQLLSLLFAWEQIILEKKRYDEEGFHPSDNTEDLSPRQFLILFRVIWGRAQAGLTDLAPSPANSTAPTGIKRSVESDSPPLIKRARSDSGGGAQLSKEARGQKRQADKQGGGESSMKRVKLDK